MEYILKGHSEALRLDQQALINQFSLGHELKDVHMRTGTRVLDVGCGSGILCRYLEKKYTDIKIFGCDLNSASLDYARSHSRLTQYFQHDFVNQSFKDSFDFIFNRLVAHHLTEEKLLRGYKNCYESLSSGGEICVIDPDGLLLNLGTRNSQLQKMIKKVNDAFSGNLKVGRLIPSILKECGFKNVSFKIEVMDFQGQDRLDEVKQWEERFESSLQFYLSTFGTEFEARRFMRLYLEEAKKEDVPLFYNKFIIKGLKL